MNAPDTLMALLFVADGPVPVSQLSVCLDLAEGPIEQALEVLGEQLKRSGPVQLVKLAGGYQLSTKPEYAELVSRFLKPQRQRLGRSLMEVLAIVAYRQPITIAEIEAVRGVQSDHSVRSLLERRLIQEEGKKLVPGRPTLYGTSAQFLHQFRLNDLSELPPLQEALEALNEPEADDSEQSIAGPSANLLVVSLEGEVQGSVES